jgi:hypothetical protein
MYYKRKANQMRQAGHVIPAINPHPPLCPFRVVEERTCSPNRRMFEDKAAIRNCALLLSFERVV